MIEDCLDTLQRIKFFSTLDMASGYYQVEIAEEDRHSLPVLDYLSTSEWKWGYVMPMPLFSGQSNLFLED